MAKFNGRGELEKLENSISKRIGDDIQYDEEKKIDNFQSIDELELFGAADDISTDRHYITMHVIAKKYSGELKVMEPDKEDEWEWFDLNNLPDKIYTPSKKFIDAYLNKKL